MVSPRARASHPCRVAILLLVPLVLAGAACGDGGRSADAWQRLEHGAATGYNLVLVTLDTVRRDRLGCYGCETAETAAFDSLTEHGVQFDDAVTPVPLTLPSHATMLTGLIPPRHGIRNNGSYRLAPEYTTLAETLREQQYDTAAFIGAFVLDQRFGLNQGFELYDFSVSPGAGSGGGIEALVRSAGEVTGSALHWLRQRRKESRESPFFVWIHYFDAHIPYRSPYRSLPRFAGRPYDAEIAYMDSQFKFLLAELDRQDLRRKTLIVLVADHGESLDEHGEATHGLFIYDSTMRVPFIISSPSLFPGPCRVTDRVVSLADLRPTVEDLLGLPLSEPRDGMSLLEKLGDAAGGAAERAVYIESLLPYESAGCSPLYGLRSPRDKLILGPRPEFYELESDPGELTNRYSADSPRVAALGADLDQRLKLVPAFGEGRSARPVSGEELARLEALGYVVASSPPASGGPLPDPRDLVRANALIKSAFQLMRQNRFSEALETNRQALALCADFEDAALQAAMIYERMNRPEEAVVLLRQFLERKPVAEVGLRLAQLLMNLKRLDEMEDALALAEREEPRNGFVHVLRGDRAMLSGRPQEAIRHYERAILLDEIRVGHLVRPQLEKVKARLRAGGAATSG